MKRGLKITGLGLLVLIAALAVLIIPTFVGNPPIPNGLKLEGVEVVKDGFVSVYIVDLTRDAVVLVDAGNDPDGKAILKALARRGLTAKSVKAILLTHGDPDHTTGVRAFPGATVMALEPDVALAEGRKLRGPLRLLRSPHDTGIRVNRILEDGDNVDFPGTRVRVFAVPGHSAGSAAFLAHGVLFLGDSAETTTDKKLKGGRWLFTDSPKQNIASLKALAERLAPIANDVKAIACSHSGVLTNGLAPLLALAKD
jgi:glyoxylase-like metal-dependent hydrolase (beta-lactamase superfamily II)